MEKEKDFGPKLVFCIKQDTSFPLKHWELYTIH